jgi:uncharacterized membrane protein
MTYNIHPILVHFPIAMLFMYSVIKIMPFKKWFPAVAWRDIERVLLVIGVLGAYAALASGETAENSIRLNRQLIEVHALFATLATWIYAALLVGEIAAIMNAKHYQYKQRFQWISPIVHFLERILCNKRFSYVFALIGFIAISVTGILGGVLAYGLSADPIAPYLIKILGITVH